MFNKILKNLIAFVVFLSISLTWYAYYKYDQKIKNSVIKWISSNISVELPDYYTHTVDNAYLTSYILKTWIFSLDKTMTLDGFYHKDWLPLAYNYCSLLKKDAFTVDNDFDNDNIPDYIDSFPYDYSNWDYNIRKSKELDFDKDGIVNFYDKDSDGNNVEDIFQWICMDRISNEDQIKKLYTKKSEDLFITHKEEIMLEIENTIFNFLETYKVEDPFESVEATEEFMNSVYGKLLFTDEVVISFWDMNLILKKKEIIWFVNDTYLEYEE